MFSKIFDLELVFYEEGLFFLYYYYYNYYNKVN